MNKYIYIVFAVIAGIVIFSATGYVIGSYFEQRVNGEKIASLEKVNNIFSYSKLINSIIAFGKISNVSGRTITLTSGTDTLEITMRANAQIYSFTTPTSSGGQLTGTPAQNVVAFEDIKVGDNLNVNMRMLPDGSFEGASAIIFAPTIQISQ